MFLLGLLLLAPNLARRTVYSSEKRQLTANLVKVASSSDKEVDVSTSQHTILQPKAEYCKSKQGARTCTSVLKVLIDAQLVEDSDGKAGKQMRWGVMFGWTKLKASVSPEAFLMQAYEDRYRYDREFEFSLRDTMEKTLTWSGEDPFGWEKGAGGTLVVEVLSQIRQKLKNRRFVFGLDDDRKLFSSLEDCCRPEAQFGDNLLTLGVLIRRHLMAWFTEGNKVKNSKEFLTMLLKTGRSDIYYAAGVGETDFGCDASIDNPDTFRKSYRRGGSNVVGKSLGIIRSFFKLNDDGLPELRKVREIKQGSTLGMQSEFALNNILTSVGAQYGALVEEPYMERSSGRRRTEEDFPTLFNVRHRFCHWLDISYMTRVYVDDDFCSTLLDTGDDLLVYVSDNKYTPTSEKDHKWAHEVLSIFGDPGSPSTWGGENLAGSILELKRAELLLQRERIVALEYEGILGPVYEHEEFAVGAWGVTRATSVNGYLQSVKGHYSYLTDNPGDWSVARVQEQAGRAYVALCKGNNKFQEALRMTSAGWFPGRDLPGCIFFGSLPDVDKLVDLGLCRGKVLEKARQECFD